MATAAAEEEALESELNIPESELKALELALFGAEVGKPEGVFTTAELAEKFGISESGMRKRIQAAMRANKMECAKFVVVDARGRRHTRVGYKMVSDEQD